MLYVMICYKSMTSDYSFHISNILKNNKHHLKITKFFHFISQKDQYKLFGNAKTHFFLQNFFRMLYVVMSYKSRTSYYCFLTSNILKSNKHHLKITKFLHLKSQKINTSYFEMQKHTSFYKTFSQCYM